MKIAFVCLHGSAKSMIAAEYLNARARAQDLPVVAQASGLEPDAGIPPYVVDGLREKGFTAALPAPAPVTTQRLAGADRVIAFGCEPGDAASGRIVEQWSDCPAVSEGFEAAWRYITRRIDGMLAVAFTAATLQASAQAMNFDADPAGRPPPGWTCGVTGQGKPRWAVTPDATAPSPPHVLVQSGAGTFPWCVLEGTKLLDGFVETRFKPIAGREDQAGGVVWRFASGDRHYVARANALEDNVSLYYTEAGSRRTLKYVDAPVAANRWHHLRVEFAGARIRVILDGKSYIEVEDRHIETAGRVGVWTKADSVTAFDDFACGPN